MVERKREIVESAHYGAPIITIAYENMILLSNIESVRKYGTRNGHAQSDDTRPSDRACAKTRAHLRALCTRDREESFSDKPELIRIMARTRRHTSPTHIHSRFITIDEYCHHSSFYQWLPNQCPGALPLPHMWRLVSGVVGEGPLRPPADLRGRILTFWGWGALRVDFRPPLPRCGEGWRDPREVARGAALGVLGMAFVSSCRPPAALARQP